MPTPTAAAEEDNLESAGTWLEANSAIVERWLAHHASHDLRQRVQKAVVVVADGDDNVPTPDSDPSRWSTAANSDEQQQSPPPIRPSSSSSLQYDRDSFGEESELFMELVRDVANELDIDVLCHKIIRNVSLLTHADRGSLFLAKGLPHERYLVAKLFDVRRDTSLEEAVELARVEDIRIPFGVGIAGTVAQNKTLINIKDAYNVSI